MAVTRLKRKAKRNKIKAKVRQEKIQRLKSKPVIKSVDVEKIAEEFKSSPKPAKSADKAKEIEEKPKAEKKATKVPAAKKEEKKVEAAEKPKKKSTGKGEEEE